MNVTDVKVRYSRKIQPAEYSPIEAEVTLTAQLSDGDDAKATATQLIADAKAAVGSALGVKPKGTETAEVEETKKEPSGRGGPGKPRKQVLTPKAAEPDDDDLMGGGDEEEEEKPKKAEKPAKAEKKAKKPEPEEAEEEDDEFGGGEESEEEESEDDDGETEMSAKELQDWITPLINKKIPVAKVREILGKYGAARTTDTKAEDRPKIRKEIEAIISKKK